MWAAAPAALSVTATTTAWTGSLPAGWLDRNSNSRRRRTAWRCHRPGNARASAGEAQVKRPGQAAVTPGSRSGPGLVFGPGSQAEGAWDQAGAAWPVVRRFSTVENVEESWMLYYTAPAAPDDNVDEDVAGDEAAPRLGPGSCAGPMGSVGVATSANGVVWRRGAKDVNADEDAVGQMMTRNSGNWWTFDVRQLAASDVLLMSSGGGAAGVYWLYYAGGDFELVDVPEQLAALTGLRAGPQKGLRTRIGLAMSQDGRHFARIEGDHHSGAILDCGEAGTWDEFGVVAPQVVMHATGDMRMYYHAFDQTRGCFTVGLARSRDGIRWKRIGRVLAKGPAGAPDERGAAARCVVPAPSGQGYLMLYEALSAEGKHSICLATSDDGLTWSRSEGGPVLSAAAQGSWDSEGVGQPCLVDMEDGQWRLYYTGWDASGVASIGMAESSDLQNFKRSQHTLSL
eukprot:jgi/Chlat1/5964/Chrsp4S06288